MAKGFVNYSQDTYDKARAMWGKYTPAEITKILKLRSSGAVQHWAVKGKWGPALRKYSKQPRPWEAFKKAAADGLCREEIMRELGVSGSILDDMRKESGIELRNGNRSKKFRVPVVLQPVDFKPHGRTGYPDHIKDEVIAAMIEHDISTVDASKQSGIGLTSVRRWAKEAGLVRLIGDAPSLEKAIEMKKLQEISIPFGKWKLSPDLREWQIEQQRARYETTR